MRKHSKEDRHKISPLCKKADVVEQEGQLFDRYDLGSSIVLPVGLQNNRTKGSQRWS